MEVLRYEYDPCVMHRTVNGMIYGFYDISTRRNPICVIIFKSDPNKCGNTENMSKSGTAWPKNELIFRGVAITYVQVTIGTIGNKA